MTQEADYTDAEAPPTPSAADRTAELRALENQVAVDIRRAIRDGTLDDSMLDRWEDLQRNSAPSYYQAGRFSGGVSLLEDLAAAGADRETVRYFQSRIDNLSKGIADPNLGADLLKALRPDEASPSSSPTPSYRPPTTGAPPQAPTFRTMDEADFLFSKGKIPLDVYKKAREKFGIRPDGSRGPNWRG